MNIWIELTQVLLTMVGVIAICRRIVFEIKMRRARKKLIDKLPKLLDAKSSAVCADGHGWFTRPTHLDIPGIGAKPYVICKDCGYVSGEDLVLDETGLKHVTEYQEEKDEEVARINKANKEIVETLQGEMERWITRNSLGAQNADILRKYHVFVIDKFTEVGNKKRAELAYQEEEKRKYETLKDADT